MISKKFKQKIIQKNSLFQKINIITLFESIYLFEILNIEIQKYKQLFYKV